MRQSILAIWYRADADGIQKAIEASESSVDHMVADMEQELFDAASLEWVIWICEANGIGCWRTMMMHFGDSLKPF